MRNFKSERLKKLEAELKDLEQWMRLGLVPKKDVPKHQEEISSLQEKIDEELDRLQVLKESGDWEEYVTPKRQAGRGGYTEMPTVPDLGGDGDQGNSSNTTEEYTEETETGSGATQSGDDSMADNESGTFFGRRRRWDGIIDPERDDAW